MIFIMVITVNIVNIMCKTNIIFSVMCKKSKLKSILRYVQDHAATLGAAAIAVTCLMVTIHASCKMPLGEQSTYLKRSIKNIFTVNIIITTNPVLLAVTCLIVTIQASYLM